MKLLTMKCIKNSGLPPEEYDGMLGQEEYFVKLESDYEETMYEDAYGENNAIAQNHFNRELEEELSGQDEDIYYYFRATEPELAIGEPYKDADGLVWERIA